MVETDLVCSKSMKEYFDYLDSNTYKALEIAKEARKKSYDPDDNVEIKLAKNMAERVVGIISVVAPQIENSGVVERIIELENKYGSQDWRVAFVIAHEIALEKFCKFKDIKEAIEIGVRTGFAYVTVGVVSSPLEGLTSIEIKKRRDGKEYFRLNYAGPIRNAGGTAAATSVLIADYVRKKMGYDKYDPDEKEIKRCFAELEDYHEYITNLQYFPFKEESEFLMKNIPVEIAGDPSEKYEISNAGLKDLPRVETNLLRSGYCLIHSSCIPLKSAKLWKKLSEWGHEFEMDDWNFLEQHIKLQKELKSKSAKKSDKKEEDYSNITEPGLLISKKIKPDTTYVKDLVGGRPVLGHPMRSGAFRLRYGRSRGSGLSGQCTHPATMGILNDLIAIGTQLKVERPGKAAAFTPCDYLMGPIVKLKDKSVICVNTYEEAKKITDEVEEIIYIGDTLVSYGDFFDRAAMLIPPGYVEEYWILEVKEALEKQVGKWDLELYSKYLNISEDYLKKLFDEPIKTKISFDTAYSISEFLSVPLHPAHIYFYKEIDSKQFKSMMQWFTRAQFFLEIPKIILPLTEEFTDGKRALEILGVPHKVENETVIISSDYALSLSKTLNVQSDLDAKEIITIINENKELNPLEIINKISSYKIKDKSGIFIGARMGRPEKGKMRKMKGNPHGLFPIGEDGGRLRSFQSAFESGKVTSNFPVFICPKCQNKTPLRVCEVCDTKTIRQKIEYKTGEEVSPKIAEMMTDKTFVNAKEWNVQINSIFDSCLKKLNTKIYPDLIKGVKGMVSKDKDVEHPIKAILRAKHNVAVNKDGTIRFDASEIALTHFKPIEIGVPFDKLKKLGYTYDIYNNPLTNNEQILELKVQDVVLPTGLNSPEEGSDKILLRTSQFIDDLLVNLYKLPPYYNATEPNDLVGELVIGLAPHTSAGTVGRIIGWTKSQGLMAHPLYHSAMRRDCDGDESCVFLVLDAFLNFSQKFLGTSRGSTMDAPLVLTTLLNPSEVDDMAFNVDIADKYPLEFYKACESFKMPWDVKIKQIKQTLGTEKQFEGMMFTHNTTDLNDGVLCSAYKTLPSMEEKINCQMNLAEKLRAVDTTDVARLIIEKHFIRDTRGNLRKFSIQQFRCGTCNTKYRRPPLMGKCDVCKSKIIFTISEGSIVKYLDLSIGLATKYNVSSYLKESLELTKKRVLHMFGEEKEVQTGLDVFFT
jgi:DNA polymerase II large subunit